MESCARFLPLQLKVATYRLRSDFQCNLVGAAEDTFAVRESRATFMSTRQDCYSCLRGYSHETRRRNWLCSTESRNWVAGRGLQEEFSLISIDRNEIEVCEEIDLYRLIVCYVSFSLLYLIKRYLIDY